MTEPQGDSTTPKKQDIDKPTSFPGQPIHPTKQAHDISNISSTILSPKGEKPIEVFTGSPAELFRGILQRNPILCIGDDHNVETINSIMKDLETATCDLRAQKKSVGLCLELPADIKSEIDLYLKTGDEKHLARFAPSPEELEKEKVVNGYVHLPRALLRECRRLDIKVCPIDVNQTEMKLHGHQNVIGSGSSEDQEHARQRRTEELVAKFKKDGKEDRTAQAMAREQVEKEKAEHTATRMGANGRWVEQALAFSKSENLDAMIIIGGNGHFKNKEANKSDVDELIAAKSGLNTVYVEAVSTTYRLPHVVKGDNTRAGYDTAEFTVTYSKTFDANPLSSEVQQAYLQGFADGKFPSFDRHNFSMWQRASACRMVSDLRAQMNSHCMFMAERYPRHVCHDPENKRIMNKSIETIEKIEEKLKSTSPEAIDVPALIRDLKQVSENLLGTKELEKNLDGNERQAPKVVGYCGGFKELEKYDAKTDCGHYTFVSGWASQMTKEISSQMALFDSSAVLLKAPKKESHQPLVPDKVSGIPLVVRSSLANVR